MPMQRTVFEMQTSSSLNNIKIRWTGGLFPRKQAHIFACHGLYVTKPVVTSYNKFVSSINIVKLHFITFNFLYK